MVKQYIRLKLETVYLVPGPMLLLLLLHRGFRYSKDGQITRDGRQAWKCVKKNDKCRGRLYSLNVSLVTVTQTQNHDADIAVVSSAVMPYTRKMELNYSFFVIICSISI